MRYFICKPNSHKINESLVNRIKMIDNNAELVDNIKDANVCIFQKGWTRSKKCVEIYIKCKDEHIEYCEEYMYDLVKGVHLN